MLCEIDIHRSLDTVYSHLKDDPEAEMLIVQRQNAHHPTAPWFVDPRTVGCFPIRRLQISSGTVGGSRLEHGRSRLQSLRFDERSAALRGRSGEPSGFRIEDDDVTGSLELA
jgi:hypothetical protein